MTISGPFRVGSWMGLAALYLLACLATDSFPRHGPPDFRYTGSDPNFPVWNLGWPMALLIYDSRSGFHDGPTEIPVIIFEFLVLALGVVALIVLHLLRKERHVARSFPIEDANP
jgi:hypothetical protein